MPLAISAASWRGAECPTLKTNRKQPKKVLSGSRAKCLLKQPKILNSRNIRKTTVLTVFRLFVQLFFGCFTGTLPGTHSAPFSAVFRFFSMSGIWQLSSWPQRLQPKPGFMLCARPTASQRQCCHEINRFELMASNYLFKATICFGKRGLRTNTGTLSVCEKITGTNDFAYFSRQITWTRGGRKKSKKCPPAGTVTKI